MNGNSGYGASSRGTTGYTSLLEQIQLEEVSLRSVGCTGDVDDARRMQQDMRRRAG